MNALHVLVLSLASLGAGETVLLDFSVDACGPCRQMLPVMDQLASEGYPVRTVDSTRDAELAKRFDIQALPTFVMVVDGREVDRSVGATSRQRLLAMLAKAPTASCRDGACPRSEGTLSPGEVTPHRTDWQNPWPVANRFALPMRPASAPLNVYQGGVRPGAAASAGAATSSFDQGLEQRLLAATVRLRVNDPQGHSFGTGTIVDAGDGEALILTCAHIFRDSGGRGGVSADLFCPGGPSGVPCKLIGYNMESDVALVAVRPGVSVSPVRVAPVGYFPRRGEPVISIGCNRGDDPTVQVSRVTSTDKISQPSTFTVAGQPVQGRSGGGLFSASGEIIAVCYAADPQDNEGLYAALNSVHTELDRRGLSFVYRQRLPRESAESRLAGNRAPELPRELPSNVLQAQQQAAEQMGTKTAIPASAVLNPDGRPLSDAERAVFNAVSSGAVTQEFLQQLATRQAGASSLPAAPISPLPPAGASVAPATSLPEPPAALPQPPISVPPRLPRPWGE